MPKIDYGAIWRFLRVFATFLGHALGALAVTYGFLLVLVTAAAQQRVITRLEAFNNTPPPTQIVQPARDEGADESEIEEADPATEAAKSEVAPARERFDYSSGRVRLEAAVEAGKKIDTIKQKYADQRRYVRVAKKEYDEARDKSKALSAKLTPLFDKAQKVCSKAGTNSILLMISSEARWQRAKQCGDTNPVVAEEVVRQTDNYYTYQESLVTQRKASSGHQTAVETLEATGRDLSELQNILKAAEPLGMIFSDVTALKDTFPLSPFVAKIPPAILQIVMAFVSGLFGALLVTLVLIVYPNNSISASAGGKILSRIFLGGLISTGVYIVLGGGTALLGGNIAFDESKANFMTFCAVGVLAGMFSDRVALWLSKRADTFFGERDKLTPESSPEAGGTTTTATTTEPHTYG